jgi:hypothetical protein
VDGDLFPVVGSQLQQPLLSDGEHTTGSAGPVIHQIGTRHIIGMTMHNGLSRSLRERDLRGEDCEEQNQAHNVRAF